MERPTPGRTARRPAPWSILLGVLILVLSLDAASANVTDPTASRESGMTLLDAVILGLVEGITEYLPVSSTGHLILAQRALGLERSDAANAFAISVQAGAIAAVLLIYRRRLGQVLRGIAGRDPQGRALGIHLAIAFAPAVVAGLLFEDSIEQHLFGLKPIVAAWIVGGFAILLLDKRLTHVREGGGLGIHDLAWRGALAIGCAQCLALWPGTSRSLATILGGLVVGLGIRASVEFSFLLGVITLGAASAYKAWQGGTEMVETYGWASLGVGFAVATVSAAAAVRWMVGYLERHGLAIFGYYRILLGAIVASLLYAGVL